MTCQCTCGKHILVNISTSPNDPVTAAVRSAAYPVTLFHEDTAVAQPFVNVIPNAAGASVAIPPLWHIDG